MPTEMAIVEKLEQLRKEQARVTEDRPRLEIPAMQPSLWDCATGKHTANPRHPGSCLFCGRNIP